MKTILRVLILFSFLVIALAGFVFIRYNQTETGLWLGVDFSPRPAGQWLLLFFISGCVVGLIAGHGLYRYFRERLRLRMLETRLSRLTEENRSLQDRLAAENPDSASS